jgi:hypothetical protein
MAGLSQYSRMKLLDHFASVAQWSVPSLWIGLHTGYCSATGAGLEVTTGATAYARMTCSAWSSATAANPSVLQNSGIVTFPTATGNWGAIVSVSLYDTATGGNYLGYASITAKTITTNDVARFAAGAFQVTLAETA